MRIHKLSLTVATVAVAMTASAVSGQVVTSAGGEVSKLTQKNIVDRLIVGDSLEVEMAKLAVERTKSAAVRDLANQLITDHRAHLDSLRKFASKPDVGRETIAGDTESQQAVRTFAQLRAMPAADSTFDRVFVTAQIQSHERAIDALKKAKPAVTNADLQGDIDRALTTLEAHLGRAKGVASMISSPK